MDTTTRYIVGLTLLLAIQVLLGGTVVFLIRRKKHVEPAWSWPKTLGVFFLLGVLATVIGILPVIGRYGAVVVSLIGLKRISGLDLLSTFILSFCVGVSVFLVAGVLSTQLHVDLLGLRD